MNYQNVRELYPCPDCGVDAGEYCLSKSGDPMSRFIHPNRNLALKTSIEETFRLREWLRRHAVIFRETA